MLFKHFSHPGVYFIYSTLFCLVGGGREAGAGGAGGEEEKEEGEQEPGAG